MLSIYSVIVLYQLLTLVMLFIYSVIVQYQLLTLVMLTVGLRLLIIFFLTIKHSKVAG